MLNKDAKEVSLINKDAKNSLQKVNKRRWTPSARNTNSCKYAKAVERKLQTAPYHCEEEGRYILTWPNKRIRSHVASLSAFSLDSVSTCSFKKIFLMEVNIT